MAQHTPRCPAQDFDVDRTVGANLWNEFAAIVPASHSFETVCEPTYFGSFRSTKDYRARNQDNGLRPGDYISVKCEDNSYQARLIVRDVPAGLDQVHTQVVWVDRFDAEDIPEGYDVTFRGARGWVITLNKDEIESGFATAESARNRIEFFERSNKAQQRVTQARKKPAAKKTEPAKETETA